MQEFCAGITRGITRHSYSRIQVEENSLERVYWLSADRVQARER